MGPNAKPPKISYIAISPSPPPLRISRLINALLITRYSVCSYLHKAACQTTKKYTVLVKYMYIKGPLEYSTDCAKLGFDIQ